MKNIFVTELGKVLIIHYEFPLVLNAESNQDPSHIAIFSLISKT